MLRMGDAQCRHCGAGFLSAAQLVTGVKKQLDMLVAHSLYTVTVHWQ